MNLIENLINNIVLEEIDPYKSVLKQNLTGIGTMINVGRDRTAIGKADLVQYSAILDKRVCPLCKHLDGNVTKVGSPEYLRYMPRVHHNCRCIYVYISRDESRQPKVFFPKVPEDLDKLGSLISETVSAGGAIATITSLRGILASTKFSQIKNIDERLNKFDETERQLLIDYIDQLNENDFPVGVIDEFIDKMFKNQRKLTNYDMVYMRNQLYRIYRDRLEDVFDEREIQFNFGSNLNLYLGLDVVNASKQYQVINFMHNHLDDIFEGDFQKALMNQYRIKKLGNSVGGQFVYGIYDDSIKDLDINLNYFQYDEKDSKELLKNGMESGWKVNVKGENAKIINQNIYTLIHEMGHSVDYRLFEQKYHKKGDRYNFWSDYNVDNDFLNKEYGSPSQYGKTNAAERFAECFVDLCLSDNPTEASKEMAKKMKIDYKKFYIKPENLKKLLNEIDF